ncbi:CPBP family glutamic-type intramembrane protease [Saccharopolyspora hirsuta]|uniref:CPBP family glutamic-type intramembrane protease n=1 Tax=Saccharopolyspora hirsuta TaxID=1837 RepID=UPI00331FCB2B
MTRAQTAVLWVAVVGLATGLPASLAVAAGWAAGRLVLPPIVLAVLLVLAFSGRKLRPVLLVLAATVAGLYAITVVAERLGPWLSSQPIAVGILVVNGAKLVPVALVALVLVVHRPRVEDSALRFGDPRAATGLRVAGRALDWRWTGTAVAVLLVGGPVLASAELLDADGLRAAARWLPVCALAALINSAAEELLFRHGVNAVAAPLLGRTALIALTTAYFGITHLNGTPGGLAGVLLGGGFGLVLAIAVAQTRGFCWNWPLHFVADLVIFSLGVALGG